MMDKIESLKNNYPTLGTRGHQDSKSNLSILRKNLEVLGEEGFDYLIEKAKADNGNEFVTTTNLIALFSNMDVDATKFVDLIKHRAMEAKDDIDISHCLPLYANLGFFKADDRVTDFLISTLTKERLADDWPLLSKTISKNYNNRVIQVPLSEFEDQIRLVSVVALFNVGTEEVLQFLRFIEENEPESSYLRNSINYYFDKIAEFGSLIEFYKHYNDTIHIIE